MTQVSKVITFLLNPLIIPLVAFVALFYGTYLRIFTSSQYKFIVIGMIFCFTALLPSFILYVYAQIQKVPYRQLTEQKRRFIPYLLTITSFLFCTIITYRLKLPIYMTGVVIAPLITIILFAIANFKWRLSIHTGGMGVIVGYLVSFSAIFGYNPIVWLCVFIIVAGLVGTARIILSGHTLNSVLAGFTIGLVCTILVLHPAFRFSILNINL